MARDLGDLPFVLTKRGVHIATISPANGVHMALRCTQGTIRTAQQLSREESIMAKPEESENDWRSHEDRAISTDGLPMSETIVGDNFFRPMPK